MKEMESVSFELIGERWAHEEWIACLFAIDLRTLFKEQWLRYNRGIVVSNRRHTRLMPCLLTLLIKERLLNIKDR